MLACSINTDYNYYKIYLKKFSVSPTSNQSKFFSFSQCMFTVHSYSTTTPTNCLAPPSQKNLFTSFKVSPPPPEIQECPSPLILRIFQKFLLPPPPSRKRGEEAMTRQIYDQSPHLKKKFFFPIFSISYLEVWSFKTVFFFKANFFWLENDVCRPP